MIQNLLSYELEFWQKGFSLIAGVDEVGRGCLAGPVIAGAVILPNDENLLKKLDGVNDSKKLSAIKRRKLFSIIQEVAIDYSIGIVSANVIDEVNILQATFWAMRRALSHLEKFDYIFVDGNKKIPHIKIDQLAIIKGDSKSLSVAAASILAKVVRDEIMIELSKYYDKSFDFESNKGYPTQKHITALKTNGLLDIHRITFCKNFLD